MSAPEAVVGLEIHLRVATRTKLFCGCPVTFGAPPNTACCPVCLGHPGALPVLNAAALEKGLRLAAALGFEVPELVSFDRKSYGYPDLPKGYQITQLDRPLGRRGQLAYETADGRTAGLRLVRLHLEEDAARSEHSPHESRLDFNRAGVPLLEIVTAPDLRSPGDAVRAARAIREIARAVGASGAALERGEMRVEPNVNVRGADGAVTPITEVKNLGSFAALRGAIRFEIERQTAVLADETGSRREGRTTRGWDEEREETVLQRRKEAEAQYRYFPEPDLPPVRIDPALLERLAAELPELPAVRRKRLRVDHGLPETDAAILAAEPGLAAAFEATRALGVPAREAAGWWLGDVRKALRQRDLDLGDRSDLATGLGRLAARVSDGSLPRVVARELLARALDEDRDPEALLEERGRADRPTPEELARAVEAAMGALPEATAAVAGGKEAALGPLVGEVLRRTGGRADPRTARDALLRTIPRPG
jgi:aspartyl-tRNA(Asn)/glutamyl-tRNA(Gln) amidotransferase subunit B